MKSLRNWLSKYLHYLKGRTRFIRACWKRGLLFRPVVCDMGSLMPWEFSCLAHGDRTALFRQLRRQPWQPCNWYLRHKGKVIVMPPKPWMIQMLLAQWECEDGVAAEFAALNIPAGLRTLIEARVGNRTYTNPKKQYILRARQQFVRMTDGKVQYTPHIHNATLFNGGRWLDQFLIAHPHIKLND